MLYLMHRMSQPLLCTLGLHEAPPPRYPHGPVVSTCPCCHKVVYFYGLSAYGLTAPPNLLLPAFPRVMTALPPARGS